MKRIFEFQYFIEIASGVLLFILGIIMILIIRINRKRDRKLSESLSNEDGPDTSALPQNLPVATGTSEPKWIAVAEKVLAERNNNLTQDGILSGSPDTELQGFVDHIKKNTIVIEDLKKVEEENYKSWVEEAKKWDEEKKREFIFGPSPTEKDRYDGPKEVEDVNNKEDHYDEVDINFYANGDKEDLKKIEEENEKDESGVYAIQKHEYDQMSEEDKQLIRDYYAEMAPEQTPPWLLW